MNELITTSIKIYGITDYDWLSFKITNENPLTNHHIKKDEHGGRRIISNLAPLTKLAHQYLHEIERIDIDAYNTINYLFQVINDSGEAATPSVLELIQKTLLEYEQEHKSELEKKIKHMHLNMEAIKRVMPRRLTLSPTSLRLVMQEGIDPIIHKTKKARRKQKQKIKKRVWRDINQVSSDNYL